VTRPSRRRSRELALQALYAWQQGGGDALEQLRALGEAPEGGLAQSLVQGVLERAEEPRALIAPCLDRDFARLSPVERAILYIGAFELAAHPETPFKVVVNEAIELGKSFGGTGGHKFVNGVLERLAAGLRPDVAGRRKQPA
jgi:N utilization substance protein B